MKWSSLTDATKNVLEWMENPYTDERELLKITKGTNFIMSAMGGKTQQFVSEPLYEEIKKYLESNKKMYNVYEHGNTLYTCLRAIGMVKNK